MNQLFWIAIFKEEDGYLAALYHQGNEEAGWIFQDQVKVTPLAKRESAKAAAAALLESLPSPTPIFFDNPQGVYMTTFVKPTERAYQLPVQLIDSE
jgi:hypothetical protein